MNIQKQLHLCDIMGASGFVIHIPNESVNSIVDELSQVNLASYHTPVYLETKASNPAGKGSMNYELAENLDKLFTQIAGQSFGNRVGHCVDTAHLWSSGVSMTTKSNVVKYFTELSLIAGGHLWHKIHGDNNGLMFHLNDAVNEFANGKDEHQLLGVGRIWSNDKSGLKTLIEFIKSANLIAILERNKDEGLQNDCTVIQ
jgi:endonuclease IV